MKRILAFIIAFSALISAVSCKKDEKSKFSESSDTAIVAEQTSYKEQRAAMPENFVTLIKLCSANGAYQLFYVNNQQELMLAKYNENYEIAETIKIFDKATASYCVDVNDDGSFIVLSSYTDFVFEYDESGVVTNFEDYLENAELTFKLTGFDSSMNIISENEVEGLSDCFNKESSMLTGIYSYGENYIVDLVNGLVLVSKRGELLDFNNDEMNGVKLGKDSNGDILCTTFQGVGYMDNETLSQPSEIINTSDTAMISFYEGIVKGCGEYKAFMHSQQGIYGLTEDNKFVLVVDFGKSYIKTDDISVFASCKDGEFMAHSVTSGKMSVYTVLPDDYSSNRKVIDIVQINCGDGLANIGIEFSRMNEEYEVSVKELVSFDEVKNNILKGEAPDIVAYMNSGIMYRLANMGGLVDLNKYIDSDIGLNREELMPNVLEAYEYKGGVYGLPQIFEVGICYANSDYIGKEYKSLTYEQLYDFYENRPDGMYLSYDMYYENSPFSFLCMNSTDSWIDYKNYTCNFNSPEFVELIEFCRDVEITPFFKFELPTSEMLYALKNKKEMLNFGNGVGNSVGIGDTITTLASLGFDYSEANIISRPGNVDAGIIDSAHNYSIVANGDCNDGAWKFLSYYFSADKQNDIAQMGWNVLNKNSFEMGLDIYTQKGDTPKIVDGGYNDIRYQYRGDLTPDEVQEYYDFVLSCTKLAYRDSGVDEICYDEYNRFIAGDITAQECAANIQSRMEIMLSEQI